MQLFYINKDKATWCFVIRKKQTARFMQGNLNVPKNKRPMGHIANLSNISNQYTCFRKAISFQKVDKEREISFLRIDWFLFVKLFSPKPRMFCPNLVEIGPVVLEKKVLNFINVFSLLLYLSLWKDVWSFSA